VFLSSFDFPRNQPESGVPSGLEAQISLATVQTACSEFVTKSIRPIAESARLDLHQILLSLALSPRRRQQQRFQRETFSSPFFLTTTKHVLFLHSYRE
jgi:hypothetical protein